MKKLLLVAIVLAGVAIASYMIGYAKAEREYQSAALGHALENAGVSANALNTLADDRQQTTIKLLDLQLRSAVDRAEQLSRAGAKIPIPVPNLIEGLRRAKQYSDRVGDANLSRRLASLYAKLSKQAPNFAFKWPAGRSPLSGLKPLLPPDTDGVRPLADRARRLPR